MDYKETIRVNLLIIAVFMAFIAVIALNFGADTGITGAAVGECEVNCNSDAECYDNNEATEDVCLHAGECSSKCLNVN